ncbi:MAG: hypothetical protein EXS13_04545 [Planctomycetes bacterium]|nr:hypothetical protein [Planctomycetota bacterium]
MSIALIRQSLAHVLRPLAGLVVFVVFASGLRAQARVGSFVDGERPMYIECSPWVDGQSVHFELRNLPAGAKGPLLIWSLGTDLIDLTALGIPGHLGPDLTQGGLIIMDGATFTYDDVLPTGIAGLPVYIQASVSLPGDAGRLSSMTVCSAINPGDDPGTTPTIKFPLPLTVTEWTAPGHPTLQRTQEAMRVGLPLPIGQVQETAGVPQLTILGANEGQFSTLAKWPDGSVKWALCEWRADLAAGGSSTAYSVDKGSGNFGGTSLASVSGSVVTVDTGSVTVKFDPASSSLFDSYVRAGREVFDTAKGNFPRFWDSADVEWTWHEDAVALRRNGPVRAEIEVNGRFTRSSAADDADRVYARFYVELSKGSAAAKVTASLRNSAVSFPEHLFYRGFTWRGYLNEAGVLEVRLPQMSIDGLPPGTWNGTLPASTDTALFDQGFAKLKKDDLCYDANWSTYVPLIERFGDDDFAVEGVQARVGATYFTGDATTGYRTAQHVFAATSFLELNAPGGGRGVMVGLPYARYYWPINVVAEGDARIEVGLLPHLNPANAHAYTLTYACAETRFFWVMPEATPAADPIADSYSHDAPLGARAETWVYNQSDVWHWKLISKTELDEYTAHSGIRTPQPAASGVIRTIYEYSNTTGAGGNSWDETRRFYQWLRGGLGGAAVNSWMEAIYKVDKMPWLIDDSSISQRLGIRNKTAAVTKKDDYYNNSKHTYWQIVPDWGFARGETYLLDSGRHMSETLLDDTISANVKPDGNFVCSTFGAIVNVALAVLDYYDEPALATWVHDICFQWSNVVFQVDNNFGVSTTKLGWQATVGTAPGTALNPDGYMISWDAGKSSDRATYGYITQGWTDIRNGAQAYERYVHYLREHDPADPLINDLMARSEDWYHYAHRSMRDDWNQLTGDYYILDVFRGDAGDPAADPFSEPGFTIGIDDGAGYTFHSLVNLKLDNALSETAFSYGVELHSSMGKSTFDASINDPVLNEFIWRYLVHYGKLKP